MKEIQIYKCEICGTTYYDKKICMEHEKICSSREASTKIKFEEALKNIVDTYKVTIHSKIFNYSEEIIEDFPIANISFNVALETPDNQFIAINETTNTAMKSEFFNIIESYILKVLQFDIEGTLDESVEDSYYGGQYQLNNETWNEIGRKLCGRKIRIKTIDNKEEERKHETCDCPSCTCDHGNC
jgi:hypothetical protein